MATPLRSCLVKPDDSVRGSRKLGEVPAVLGVELI